MFSVDPSAPRPVPVPTPTPRPSGSSDDAAASRPLCSPQVGRSVDPFTAADCDFDPGAPFDPATTSAAEQRANLTFGESKLLSCLAYDAEVGAQRFGWEVREVHEDPWSGFRAIIAKPLDPRDGRTVVAYAGTEPSLGLGLAIDAVTDVRQALGALPEQHRDALECGVVAKERFGETLVFTGHSLGGGEASLAGQFTGSPSLGINSAPLGAMAQALVSRFGLDPEGELAVQLNVDGEFVSSSSGLFGEQPGTLCTVAGQSGLFSSATDHSLASVDLEQEIVCGEPEGSSAELSVAWPTELVDEFDLPGEIEYRSPSINDSDPYGYGVVRY